MRKGSITVFLSLTMVLVLSLLLASLFSVRIAACRAVSAEAADEAVFSLFSEYDRDLFERYHVFFLDGGLDTGSPAFPAHIRFLKDSADYILHPGKGRLFSSGTSPLTLELESCELTGYTSASELGGRIFAGQAVEYMEHTLGIQGVQLLLSGSSSSSDPDRLADSGGAVLSTDLKAGMDKIRSEAASAAVSPEGTVAAPPAVPAEPVENPIEMVSEYKKHSLLSLVLPSGAQVSDKKVDAASLPSARTPQPSLGIVTPPPAISGTRRILFHEYILQHTGCFTAPGSGSLSYGAEYILAGKPSDEANLTSAVRSLMLLRTGANAAAILADASLKAQASQTALTIATALAVPELQPAVEALLIAAWAWCESIVDLRALLNGKKVAVIKNASSWQLTVANIPKLLSREQSFDRDQPGGIDYQGYLRMLLLSGKQENAQKRLLDLVESTIRTVCSRPSFRIDLCVDSLEAAFTIRAENVLVLTATRKYSYREEV